MSGVTALSSYAATISFISPVPFCEGPSIADSFFLMAALVAGCHPKHIPVHHCGGFGLLRGYETVAIIHD
jgi:hypothetical protein